MDSTARGKGAIVAESVRTRIKYEWTIAEFLKLMEDKSYPRVVSKPFSPSKMSHFEFHIELYPKGTNTANTKFITSAVSLTVTKTLTATIGVKLSILDKFQNVYTSSHNSFGKQL